MVPRVWFSVVLAWVLVPGLSAPQAWRDPSPHQVRFVTVESSVRLEVLDWGGSGRPIVFVGCDLTAHAYDEIAPKLTDRFHVYAVTRRGVGASDRPAAGYDPQRRADDILEVIRALGLQKPVLIGNSCGGDILHTLGAQHSDRLGGLVYLDAAEDPTLTMTDYVLPPVDMANLPAKVGKPVPVTLPESERRQMAARPLDAAIRKAIVEDNRVRPDYARIRVPVLSIDRTETMEQTLTDYAPATDRQRAAAVQVYAAKRARLAKWQADLLAGVPSARIVELPGASLYMFLSNEADVLREVRAFAAGVQEPRFTNVTLRPSTMASGERWTARVGDDGGFVASNATLKQLIESAYRRSGFDSREIAGGPDWIETERFDLFAENAGGLVLDADGLPSRSLQMLQALLADRFQLRIRSEARQRPVFTLMSTATAPGPRLTKSGLDCVALMHAFARGERGMKLCGAAPYPGRLVAHGLTMTDLAALLSTFVDRPVVDRTGLRGAFDIDLEAVEITARGPFGPSYRPSSTKQTILESLPVQLGLRLEPVTAPIDVLVVESAERPGRN